MENATAEWFFARNNQQQGPVTWQAICAMAGAGQLLHSDLVWRQGMANWLPAAQVQGLFPAFSPMPPIPQAAGTPVPGTPVPGTPVPFAQPLPYGTYAQTGPSHQGTAVTAFILSIIGLFVCAIGLEPAALVLSYNALQGMKSGGNTEGKGLAVAARVIAIFGMIGWGIWMVFRMQRLGMHR